MKPKNMFISVLLLLTISALLLLSSCQPGKAVAGKAVEGEICSDANPCDAGLVCVNGYCLTDSDGDGLADDVDGCPETLEGANPIDDGCSQAQVDSDFDGVCSTNRMYNVWCSHGLNDNCPSVKNPSQRDGDNDGMGDECEADNLFYAPDTACALPESLQFLEWASQGDGILVLDRNHDGEIQLEDMFGANSLRDVTNSFEDLRLLDGDNSGTLDADDSLFSELRVWKNTGALLTLADAGVAGINLAYRETGDDVVGQLGTYKSIRAVELDEQLLALQELGSESCPSRYQEDGTTETEAWTQLTEFQKTSCLSEISLSEQILQIQAELEVESNRLAGGAWLKTTTATITGNIFILDLDGDGVETRDDLVVGDEVEGDQVCLSVGAGCGNGVVEDPELCDDGNKDEMDSCLSSCTYRPLSKDDFLSELINQLENEESDNINREKVKILFTQFLQGVRERQGLQ